MGYDVSSTGRITIPASRLDSIWAAFCSADNEVNTTAVKDEGSIADKVARTIASNFGRHEFESYCSPTDPVVMDFSAYGRTCGAESILSIVAAHGGTGSVEAVGEDNDRWRWRLVDDEVLRESGYTVYVGDVDTSGWIAQLQFYDDNGFDHVAVLPSEEAAHAQIAAWCRSDYLECGLPAGAVISDTDDDATVIERWTNLLGGVRHRIHPVASALTAPEQGSPA